jgi:hypothetical protein
MEVAALKTSATQLLQRWDCQQPAAPTHVSEISHRKQE